MLNRRAQSTLEYAILIGAVVAVAAGVLSGLLKSGMSHKQHQAMGILDDAGTGEGIPEAYRLSGQNYTVGSYSQEARHSNIDFTTYVDAEVLKKGGAVERKQYQEVKSEAISAEMVDEVKK